MGYGTRTKHPLISSAEKGKKINRRSSISWSKAAESQTKDVIVLSLKFPIFPHRYEDERSRRSSTEKELIALKKVS